MNNPSRVIGFVNAGHFIDHYSMLIFAAAVIVMGPAFGMTYSELLPYATPGFVAFGVDQGNGMLAVDGEICEFHRVSLLRLNGSTWSCFYTIRAIYRTNWTINQ